MGAEKVALGVIGFGNMGAALVKGIVGQPQLAKQFAVTVYELDTVKAQQAVDLGATLASSVQELTAQTQLLILAVKPDRVAVVLHEIQKELSRDKVLISIVAGATIEALHAAMGQACPVARVMPNTLVTVGQGIFGLCLDDTLLTEKQKNLVRTLFAGIGDVLEFEESKMNAFSALAGCGPAYAYYFAEALAEAGVFMGLDRPTSTKIAIKLLQGSGTMAAVRNSHLSQLREEVTSPGGTTIAATTTFDQHGVRGAIIAGVQAAFAKGKAMEENEK